MRSGPRTVLRTFVFEGRPLTLLRRGDVLELVLGNVPLLSSAALETERLFGRLASGAPLSAHPMSPVDPGSPPRVLVGGLGFGATVRGVLDVLPEGGRVLVAEKLDAVVDIARSEAAELTGGILDDPRVTLVRGDVADVIARERDLGAILLDVDNGPEWASFRSNARLYAEADLVRARQALVPGGLYAVWSGYPADAFVPRLRRAGFAPRIEPLSERGVVRARAYVGVAPAA